MTDNNRPPGPSRVDEPALAAQVAQLKANDRLHSTLLVNRALGDLSNLANALEFLTQAANQGHPQARQVLTLLFANLDAARAASAGIVTAHATPREVR